MSCSKDMRTSVSLPVLKALRERIQRLEGGAARPRTVLPFGIKAIDQASAGGRTGARRPARGGRRKQMARSTVRRRHSSPRELPRAHGASSCGVSHARTSARPPLAQAGLLPDRVIYLEAGDEPSVLACFEEGLRHRGLGAVVAELARLSMTASRRLQLAAEGSGTIGIAIRRWRPAEGGHRLRAADSGCHALARERSPINPIAGAGGRACRWQLELIRCRAGESADFEVEACDARVVSLFLPTWSTDRVRRKLGSAAPPAEAPLVLIGRDGRRRVVLAADAAAQRAGLRVGMHATKAQALVPGLIVNNADPAADAEALDRLALWARSGFTPRSSPPIRRTGW